jgi:hypothetical protein
MGIMGMFLLSNFSFEVVNISACLERKFEGTSLPRKCGGAVHTRLGGDEWWRYEWEFNEGQQNEEAEPERLGYFDFAAGDGAGVLHRQRRLRCEKRTSRI